MGELYIGVMSGTSLDGADVVIAELDSADCLVHSASTTPFPEQLSKQLRALTATPEISLFELGTLDAALGSFFASCVGKSLISSGRNASEIIAIGHSGHTIFHKPAQPRPFSMQIGDPNIIAAETGIDVVADFRRMDVAHGGQGAPLVPTFHEWCFADPYETRVALNLGGVANITVINPREPLTGFDTGPANLLLDAWCYRCWGEHYDVDGHRARDGKIVPDLLAIFLADPYFEQPPPKSTGFEYFNLNWVSEKLAKYDRTITDSDVLSTLTEVTAATVSDSIKSSAPEARRIILCGGGTFNSYLVERLKSHLTTSVVESSAAHGFTPECVEALAFAWLAKRRLENRPGSAATVTGACQTTLLGGIYSAKQHG